MLLITIMAIARPIRESFAIVCLPSPERRVYSFRESRKCDPCHRSWRACGMICASPGEAIRFVGTFGRLGMRVRSAMAKAGRLALFLAVTAVGAGAQAAAQTVAATPPMGWNSWNFFAGRGTDKDIRDTADLLVSTGMRDAGYVYVNIDDTWEGKRDAQGRIQSNEKFPDMKALADYVHSKGLKLGIYSSPGRDRPQKAMACPTRGTESLQRQSSEPVQVGVLFAGEMQEQRLQGAELLTVVSERAVVGEERDIAFPDEFAGLGDDGDIVADALDGFEHVGGHEDGAALVGEAAQPLLHERDTGGVDALEGLVEEQDLRGMDDGGGEGHALAHAGGVFGQSLGGIGEFERVEQFGDALARGDFVEAEHAGHKGQELLGIERVEEAEGFRHNADALLDGDILRIEDLTENFDGAGGGIEQAGETADGGALTGAVGPEESENAPRAHGEREVFDGG